MADAREHYNARPQVDVQKRKDSVILQLKNFNNWVKSVLIGKFTRRGDVVLDFCCGKGGDLLKWSIAEIKELFCVDIAEVSVQHAEQRYRDRRNRFAAHFYAMDCFDEELATRLPAGTQFDLVSCQFALHYSAASERRIRRGLENVTRSLKEGGRFIGTIPDAFRIMKRLREAGGTSFGNSIYNISFDSKHHDDYFGHKYFFELADAIDNCPEFVFNFPTFERQVIASEYGLKLLFKHGFHEFFTQEVDANLPLLYRMNVVDATGTIPADQWEAIGLYMVFAFEKVQSLKQG
ncbi:mRNA cap guanine-N7 methyltransferase [Irineochytrium annulatum]|nr:mRNA cap guanine-N7 methyltransferase [Irineochytrium annulatum]